MTLSTARSLQYEIIPVFQSPVHTLKFYVVLIMIGPHEGQELDLMLKGSKPLALFCDVIPDNALISENIIPELQFKPYVANGQIVRIAKDIDNTIKGMPMRYVCFSLPDQTWRAHFILWLKQEWLSGKIVYNQEHDGIIGRLLDYSEKDIFDFLEQ